ncbi:MAG: ferrous iron transport protein A [Bacilli bacterium]|nr:ferrous iron transport protein A [Bacilli bacterium]MDD4077870.1 FeoA family protein [Bacilli bacterium]
MQKRNRYRGKRAFRGNCRLLGSLVPLSSLAIGEKGRVIKICGQRSQLRRRMMDMGITVGTIIEIKRTAPVGDPVDLLVRDYRLCLRRADLDRILVEVVS